MQKPLLNTEKADGDGRKEEQIDRRKDRWTDRPTDRWTDDRPAGQTDGRMDGQYGQMEKLRNGTTDIAGYKVACTQLIMRFNAEKISKVHRLTCIWVKQRKNDL